MADGDWYGILGLALGCTEKEITKAYRTKARQFHPDKVDAADEKGKEVAARIFHDIGKAYEVLSDPTKKEEYDRKLKAKAAAKQRDGELDANRRKMKADLEAAEERAAKRHKGPGGYTARPDGPSPADVEKRLREENMRRLDALRDLESQFRSGGKAPSMRPGGAAAPDAGAPRSASPAVATTGATGGTASSLDDYERQVLENMRRAQARKKAAEEEAAAAAT